LAWSFYVRARKPLDTVVIPNAQPHSQHQHERNDHHYLALPSHRLHHPSQPAPWVRTATVGVWAQGVRSWGRPLGPAGVETVVVVYPTAHRCNHARHRGCSALVRSLLSFPRQVPCYITVHVPPLTPNRISRSLLVWGCDQLIHCRVGLDHIAFIVASVGQAWLEVESVSGYRVTCIIFSSMPSQWPDDRGATTGPCTSGTEGGIIIGSDLAWPITSWQWTLAQELAHHHIRTNQASDVISRSDTAHIQSMVSWRDESRVDAAHEWHGG
jgi:hypothetical protein